MRKKKIRVRKIRFGFRFKFTLIIGIAVTAVSLFIAFAVFSKNDSELRYQMVRFTGVILKQVSNNARDYLKNDQEIRDQYKKKYDPAQVEEFKKNRDDSLKILKEYFPAIIKNEKIFDIAFLININQGTSDEKWKASKSNRYIYFKRKYPGIEYYTNSEPILEYLYDFYMSRIDTGNNLVFSKNDIEKGEDSDNSLADEIKSDRNKKETVGDFVLIGMPVFSDDDAEKLYKDYQAFNEEKRDAENTKNVKIPDTPEKKAEMGKKYIEQLVYSSSDYDYLLESLTPDILKNFFKSAFSVSYLKPQEISEYEKMFVFKDDNPLSKGTVPLSKIKEFANDVTEKFKLKMVATTEDELWVSFYEFIRNNNISVKVNGSFEELFSLAMKSSREQKYLSGLIQEGIPINFRITARDEDSDKIFQLFKGNFYIPSDVKTDWEVVRIDMNSRIKTLVSEKELSRETLQILFDDMCKKYSINLKLANENNLWIKLINMLYREKIALSSGLPSNELYSMYSKVIFEKKFIERLILVKNVPYDCFFMMNEKSVIKAYDYFYDSYSFTGKTADDYKNIKTYFYDLFRSSVENGTIRFSKLKDIFNAVAGKFQLKIVSPDVEKDMDLMWKGLYTKLTRNNISVKSAEDLSDLALRAYRQDLEGIVGMRLLRSQYYIEEKKNRTEIINLFVSLLIRCLFISALVPGIFIRKLKYLGEGAFEIGRGNYEYKINIAGSDEFGRLSDIFNAMGKNLETAQKAMIEKNRMEEELKTAQAIQETLLPEEFPSVSGFEFDSYYSAQSESGGDYFDVIDMGGGRYCLLIADVSGHGVGSGLVMAMTRTALQIHIKESENTKDLSEKINEYLHESTSSSYFVTMLLSFLSVSNKKIVYTSSGHMPPILLREGSVTELPGGGIALGAVSNSMFSTVAEKKSLQLEKGDVFVFYTDGIVEAKNQEDEEYGYDRFRSVLEKNFNKSVKDIKESVVSDLFSFTKSKVQSDDITMLLFKVL